MCTGVDNILDHLMHVRDFFVNIVLSVYEGEAEQCSFPSLRQGNRKFSEVLQSCCAAVSCVINLL